MNRRCTRPGCPKLAATTLSFAYALSTVWLDDLHFEDHPANHDLCDRHADRTRPPRGWDLRDRRGKAAPTSTSEQPSGESLRWLRYAG